MMLMLERWDCPKLELACLLDEKPYHGYRSAEASEPWSADSALTAAARSADLEGSAWLYVVYQSDPAVTWGSKRVKLIAGGVILRPKTTPAGVETGLFRRMKFEVVAREIFHNIVGVDSKSKYAIIEHADMDYEPRKQSSAFKEPPDPLFGYSERRPDVDIDPYHPPSFSPLATVGVLLTWRDHQGDNEKWILRDETALEDFRFLLTELQRRPFVKVIMSRLRFVSDPKDTVGGSPPSLTEVCSSHLHNLSRALDAVVKVTSSAVFADGPPSKRPHLSRVIEESFVLNSKGDG